MPYIITNYSKSIRVFGEIEVPPASSRSYSEELLAKSRPEHLELLNQAADDGIVKIEYVPYTGGDRRDVALVPSVATPLGHALANARTPAEAREILELGGGPTDYLTYDTLKSTLVEGSNVFFTLDDVNRTITISSIGGGGGGGGVDVVFGEAGYVVVNNTDPARPIVGLSVGVKAALDAATTALQIGDVEAVAISGSYDDLVDKPDIPDALSDLTGDTDDVVEGDTNLYFTKDRAQDAFGEVVNVSYTEGLNFTYNPATNGFSAVNTDRGTVAITALKLEADPLPQYLLKNTDVDYTLNFSVSPTVPTAAPGTNSTVAASTAYTDAAISVATADILLLSNATAVSGTNADVASIFKGMACTYVAGALRHASRADNFRAFGLALDSIPSGGSGRVKVSGTIELLQAEWEVATGITGGLVKGTIYWLGDGGLLSPTAPISGAVVKLGVASSTTVFAIEIEYVVFL